MFVLVVVVVVGKPLRPPPVPAPPRATPIDLDAAWWLESAASGPAATGVSATARAGAGGAWWVMLPGVDPEVVRAAAEAQLRVLANRRHLAHILGDASLLEPWRGPVAEPGPRELVAVALEEWAAEPVEVPLEAWVAAARPSRGRRHCRPRPAGEVVDVDEGEPVDP